MELAGGETELLYSSLLHVMEGLVMLAAPVPTILDIEASGFGPGSYPIIAPAATPTCCVAPSCV